MKSEEKKNTKFIDLIQETPIEIWLGASTLDNLTCSTNRYMTDEFYTTRQGADIFFGFEILIKAEAPESVMLYYDSIKDVSKGVLDVLFQRFNVEDYDDDGSVEGAIVKHLEELKSREFYISRDETCTRDHLRDTIREKLSRLRQEKIEFWTLLYEEYKSQKDEYDALVRKQLKEINSNLNETKTETIEDEKRVKVNRQMLDFMLEPTHQISINIKKSDEDIKKSKSDDSWISKAGAETLLEIFTLVKQETPESACLYQNYREDVMGAVLESLAQAFNLADLDDLGSIESAIVKCLKDLKKFEFRPSIDQLDQRLNFLRQEQVEFWTLLYEEYKTKKKDYDMGSLLQLKRKFGHDERWRQHMIDSKLYNLHVREQKN